MAGSGGRGGLAKTLGAGEELVSFLHAKLGFSVLLSVESRTGAGAALLEDIQTMPNRPLDHLQMGAQVSLGVCAGGN